MNMELPLAELPPFYTPSPEALTTINSREWVCSFSGGKDSTSLVTWIEWLRRTKQVSVNTPRLVLSDTGVEFPFLQETASKLMEHLSKSGWKCEVVRPLPKEKLYNNIFGRGLNPIHPGIRNMRWCTRSTKLSPMQRFAKTLEGKILQLSGVRYGESKTRDGKLQKQGCSAGGECGLPDPDKPIRGGEVYAPIVNWRTCQVVDWLSGGVRKDVREVMSDVFKLTWNLIDIYEVKKGSEGFGLMPPKVTALRFGCIGCPAIGRDKLTGKQLQDNPSWKALKRLYQLWEECRLPQNRLLPKRKMKLHGPIRMEARQRLFPKLLAIQNEAGVVLVTKEDIAYIKECWTNKVYPKGWSEEDEKILA